MFKRHLPVDETVHSMFFFIPLMNIPSPFTVLLDIADIAILKFPNNDRKYNIIADHLYEDVIKHHCCVTFLSSNLLLRFSISVVT